MFARCCFVARSPVSASPQTKLAFANQTEADFKAKFFPWWVSLKPASCHKSPKLQFRWKGTTRNRQWDCSVNTAARWNMNSTSRGPRSNPMSRWKIMWCLNLPHQTLSTPHSMQTSHQLKEDAIFRFLTHPFLISYWSHFQKLIVHICNTHHFVHGMGDWMFTCWVRHSHQHPYIWMKNQCLPQSKQWAI